MDLSRWHDALQRAHGVVEDRAAKHLARDVSVVAASLRPRVVLAHRQYLFENPGGYCNHGFCQVAYDRQDVTRVELPSA